MFKMLSDLFTQPQPESHTPITNELAVAALMVHLASIDGHFDKQERRQIANMLKDHFALADDEVSELIKHAEQKDADAVDFYQFTSLLTQLDMDQRVEIIRMMWQVVFADHQNHELEDNMVWRVAELIGVSSRDRTRLRAEMRKAMD